MSARRAPKPSPSALVLDFQGPFAPAVEVIGTRASAFAVVRLFREPDVAIYISSDEDADALIAALVKAKKIRQEVTA